MHQHGGEHLLKPPQPEGGFVLVPGLKLPDQEPESAIQDFKMSMGMRREGGLPLQVVEVWVLLVAGPSDYRR